jgi:hypothetical protein
MTAVMIHHYVSPAQTNLMALSHECDNIELHQLKRCDFSSHIFSSAIRYRPTANKFPLHFLLSAD